MAYGTLNIRDKNNVDIGSYFFSYVSGSQATTSLWQRSDGADLSQILTPLVGGQVQANTGLLHTDGRDLAAVYDIKPGNQILPFNGTNFTAGSQSGTAVSTANITFQSNNTSWQLSGTKSAGSGALSPTQSGGIPSGAVYVRYTTTVSTNTGDAGWTNNGVANSTDSGLVALSGTSTVFNVHTQSTPATSGNDCVGQCVVYYYNSAQQLISQNAFNYNCSSTGSS